MTRQAYIQHFLWSVCQDKPGCRNRRNPSGDKDLRGSGLEKAPIFIPGGEPRIMETRYGLLVRTRCSGPDNLGMEYLFVLGLSVELIIGNSRVVWLQVHQDVPMLQ